MKEQRDMLARFAVELRAFVDSEKDQGLCPPSLNFERADYVIAALESFLSGVPLNQAFGLVVRGRPVGSGGNAQEAIEIQALRDQGMTWEAIAENKNRDVRELQRLVETYSQEIIADYAKRLIERLPVIKSAN